MRKLCSFFAYHTHIKFETSLSQLPLPTSLLFQRAVNHAINATNKKHKHNKKSEQEEIRKAMTVITLKHATEKEVLKQKSLDLKEEKRAIKNMLKEKKSVLQEEKKSMKAERKQRKNEKEQMASSFDSTERGHVNEKKAMTALLDTLLKRQERSHVKEMKVTYCAVYLYSLNQNHTSHHSAVCSIRFIRLPKTKPKRRRKRHNADT